MHAFTGPRTKTGRDYKFEQVRVASVHVGDVSIVYEHAKVELEIDSSKHVDVKFKAYKMEEVAPTRPPRAILSATWNAKLTKSQMHYCIQTPGEISFEAFNLALDGAIVQARIVIGLSEKSVKRLGTLMGSIDRTCDWMNNSSQIT